MVITLTPPLLFSHATDCLLNGPFTIYPCWTGYRCNDPSPSVYLSRNVKHAQQNMSQFIATVQTKFLCVAMVPISNEVSLRPRGLSFPHSLTLPDSDIQYIFTLKENTVVLSYYQLSCKLIQPKRLTQRLLVAYSDNRTLSNHKHQVEFRETNSKCQATLCLTAVIMCELLIVMFRQWNGRIFVNKEGPI